MKAILAFGALAAALPVASPVAAQAVGAAAEGPVIRVTVLGSGTPVPSRDQAGTAILVEAGGRKLLFDCGRGCTTRLAQRDPALVAGVDLLFLTHLHSDHVAGVPDLWLNGWTQGRAAPLRIWGPKGTKRLMAGLRKAFADDIRYRLDDGIPANDDGLKRAVTMIKRDGVVFDEGGLRVTAFRVHHGDHLPAYGYRIDFGGKSVLISGDTGPTPALAANGGGADVALMEVVSPPMAAYVRRSFAPDQAEKVLALHLSAAEAADVLAAIRPGLAVYYHTVANCPAEAALRAATAPRFAGPLLVARDLTEITILADRIETSAPPGAPECEGR
ncbi:MBL fold metallo-hydrolase [Sphingomonas canadensis]|uniref:MBL fold metallo-hydrolase n=1 Tax=Sphingomonas canadensis TaxID=1219257 RepID=A0ABW3HAA4_9SPHN|nr:MBL fold metallo-hydrolase [Sphingomonas canadensis]MCW3838123.1 MBL fold metallo-hydrolase [Sphingomonas canadensis]